MQWHERIGRRLKLRDLHILMTVVQCGSMGRAASSLAISQPAVSKAISDLETTLKVKLLDRTGQGVEPTLYGQAVLKWGLTIFNDLKQSVAEIEYLADPTRGELRLGCTEPMAAGFVSTVIEQLTRQYPKLIFHVTQADSGTLQNRELKTRNIELLVGRIPDLAPADETEAEVLFNEPIVAVAGVRSKWVRRRKVEWAELSDEPWILPPSNSIGMALFTEAFRNSNLPPPQSTVVAFSLQLTTSLLATGRYIGLVPGSMLRVSGDRLGIKALPLKLPVRAGPAGIVKLKNRMLSPVGQIFVEKARELARLLPDPH